MLKRRNLILPDLLGRLTDDHIQVKIEGSYAKYKSLKEYKEVVLRDLLWLLNTNVTIDENELLDFEHAQNSTLAFGLRSLAGKTINDTNKRIVTQEIKNAILKFEKRIDPRTLEVEMAQDSVDTSSANHKIKIKISGQLLPLQMAEKIYLKTEIDIETGKFEMINER